MGSPTFLQTYHGFRSLEGLQRETIYRKISKMILTWLLFDFEHYKSE